MGRNDSPNGHAPVKVLHATMQQHGVRKAWFFSRNGNYASARNYVKAIGEEIILYQRAVEA